MPSAPPADPLPSAAPSANSALGGCAAAGSQPPTTPAILAAFALVALALRRRAR
jgi:MYXO-CTERM domain-containing protein